MLNGLNRARAAMHAVQPQFRTTDCTGPVQVTAFSLPRLHTPAYMCVFSRHGTQKEHNVMEVQCHSTRTTATGCWTTHVTDQHAVVRLVSCLWRQRRTSHGCCNACTCGALCSPNEEDNSWNRQSMAALSCSTDRSRSFVSRRFGMVEMWYTSNVFKWLDIATCIELSGLHTYEDKAWYWLQEGDSVHCCVLLLSHIIVQNILHMSCQETLLKGSLQMNHNS